MPDLALTPAQEALRTEVRALLRERCERASVRALEASEPGYPVDLWKEMAARGWLGLAFPSGQGRRGRGLLDLAVLLEEVGAHPLPVPIQNGVVQSGLALLELGDTAQRAEHLPRIAAGERYAFCLVERDGRFGPDAVATRAQGGQGGLILEGVKSFVPFAASARELLVVARTGPASQSEPGAGLSLLLVPARTPGVRCQPLPGIGGDRAGEIVFERVHLAPERLVGPRDGAWPGLRRALDAATVALCAEMAGGTRAALECALAYARKREQFGAPIGSFQAIQHALADMLVWADAARLAVYDAASRADLGLPLGLEAAQAKVTCGEAYRRVTAAAHQIHGGVGYYDDSDLPLFYRRARALEPVLGDVDHHLEQIARHLGLSSVRSRRTPNSPGG